MDATTHSLSRMQPATTIMDTQNPIGEIIYVLPTAERPVGALSFVVKTPILYRAEQKQLEEKSETELTISAKTLEILNQLTSSIIADLEA